MTEPKLLIRKDVECRDYTRLSLVKFDDGKFLLGFDAQHVSTDAHITTEELVAFRAAIDEVLADE